MAEKKTTKAAAVKAAPKRKLPSAVISAKSKSLNVRKTPIANKQQGNPLVRMLKIMLRKFINYFASSTFVHE